MDRNRSRYNEFLCWCLAWQPGPYYSERLRTQYYAILRSIPRWTAPYWSSSKGVGCTQPYQHHIWRKKINRETLWWRSRPKGQEAVAFHCRSWLRQQARNRGRSRGKVQEVSSGANLRHDPRKNEVDCRNLLWSRHYDQERSSDSARLFQLSTEVGN